MNKNELKELVKKYFSLTEMTEETNTTENTVEQKFDSAKLVDGTEITNSKDSAFAVGDELFVITESGEHVIAPSGEHTTESGITVTVDGEGKITGIARPDGSDEGSLAEHEEDEMKEEEMSSESSEEAETETTEEKTELAEEDAEMNDHYEEGDIKEAIIEAIMSEVAPAIAELKEKLADHEMKLEEHEQKMSEYMSAPAEKPTSESRFAKAKESVKSPKAVFNVKRYEAALNRITNK